MINNHYVITDNELDFLKRCGDKDILLLVKRIKDKRLIDYTDSFDSLRQLRVRIKSGQVKEFKGILNNEKVISIIIKWMDLLRDGKRIANIRYVDEDFINPDERVYKV